MANGDPSATVTKSFKKVTLSNGLEVILHQDRTIPLVAVNVWYPMGSKDHNSDMVSFMGRDLEGHRQEVNDAHDC